MNCRKIIFKAFEYIWYTAGILFICFVIYLFLQVFVYGSFTIPSESMIPGILPGDKVIVEKVSAGARIFDFRKAARGEKFDVKRTPHWDNFKRGDVLVFNFVHRDTWDSIMMNWPVYYIKRCLAIPGDTVSIKQFRYVVNGEELKNMYGTSSMNFYYPIDSTARIEYPNVYLAGKTDTINQWTIREFGPLLIPGEGMKIELAPSLYFPYRQLIERETGLKLEMKNGEFFLNSAPISSYVFKDNYYFMAGDNINDSQDSRYWGLLPEEFIVGRAKFIWWSEKDGNIKWDRILKKVK